MKGIGSTPLVRLTALPSEGSGEVWVKLEGANPTGSMKDRMALSMVEGAEQSGRLKPGGTVVEYTGGSTGSSLALVCAVKGYRCRLVSSDAFAESKIKTMRAFGAEVELIPSENRMLTPELMQTMLARTRELASEAGSCYTDQFSNPDNRSGYHSMAEEILRDLGHVDEFVAMVGTGGAFSGNAEILSPRGTRCISLEPATSRALSGKGPLSGHRIEGTGAGFAPAIWRRDLADDVLPVTDADAFETAQALAKREGIFGGTSSGGNVWAALQRAKELGPGKRVVTIVCDSGLKYLGELYA